MNLGQVDAYHASHVTRVRQMAIMHYTHVMPPHVHPMHVSAYIKREKGYLMGRINSNDLMRSIKLDKGWYVQWVQILHLVIFTQSSTISHASPI